MTAVVVAVLWACLESQISPSLLPKPPHFSADTGFSVDEREVKPTRIGPGVATRVLIGSDRLAAKDVSLTVMVAQQPVAIPSSGTSTELVYVLEGRALLPKLRAESSPPWVLPDDAMFFTPGMNALLRLDASPEKPARVLLFVLPSGAEQKWKPLSLQDEADAAGRVGPMPRIQRSNATPPRPLPSGAGAVRLYFEKTSSPSPVAALTRLDLNPGANVAAHTHSTETEVLYVLSGSGTVTVEGQLRQVGPGTALYIASGKTHSATVDAGAPLKAIQLYTPSGPEQRFLSSTEKAPTP